MTKISTSFLSVVPYIAFYNEMKAHEHIRYINKASQLK
jgi:hypothetical protein